MPGTLVSLHGLTGNNTEGCAYIGENKDPDPYCLTRNQSVWQCLYVNGHQREPKLQPCIGLVKTGSRFTKQRP